MQKYIDKIFYPSSNRNWDDVLFREHLLRYMSEDSTVLDIGAGAGIVQQMNFKDQVAKVVGVDLDPRVVKNPFLDEGFVSDAGALPFPDESFDVVFADNVMEHIDHPEEMLIEIRRVLKPDGYFLFKTPNKFHYMPLIATITPHSFHRWVNRLRGRAVEDTFPTRYLFNSQTSVAEVSVRSNFEVRYCDLIEGRPEYLRFFFVFYLIGICYERTVNKLSFLSGFRVLIIGCLQKR